MYNDASATQFSVSPACPHTARQLLTSVMLSRSTLQPLKRSGETFTSREFQFS